MTHQGRVSGFGNLAGLQRGLVPFIKTVEVGCFRLSNTITKNHDGMPPLAQQSSAFCTREHDTNLIGFIAGIL